VRTPLRMWPALGGAGVLTELRDLIVVRACALLPPTRATWRSAAVPIANNEETRAALRGTRTGVVPVLNHALFTEIEPAAPGPRGNDIVWCSPMESRKGPRLVLEAFARTRRATRLVMVGDGPERPRLERLATRLGIADRVCFTGLVARDEAVTRMARAAVVCFTGLREEGGIALAEALLSGTPVVVLAHGGARTIASDALDGRRVALVEPGSIASTATRMAAAIDDLLARRPPETSSLLDVDAAIARFRALVTDAMATP
jgi:glycosyltransferase involved in cell wall biosynthesis